MASGNIELFKQRLDLTQLFQQQAIGEHDESFKEAGLEIKVSSTRTTNHCLCRWAKNVAGT
ncbi:hypothetical protein [Ureibacillus acetophenoni]